MQEVSIKIHDICKGEIPPTEGYYLVVIESPDGRAELSNMYWRETTHTWTSSASRDTMFIPQPYWGHLWAEDTLTKKVSV